MDGLCHRLLHLALSLFLVSHAHADSFNPKSPPECIKLVKTQSFFEDHRWKKGMVFEKKSGAVRNQGDAEFYYQARDGSAQTNCFYPWKGEMKTTSLHMCMNGWRDGTGFEALMNSDWQSTKCSGSSGSDEL
mmetsp:Transcript_145339/g.253642  ORF Transcript_145339/g.253642 Transcript_145339/m.253642 type:complete len:132 (-) Transcript_145339:100-495(-)